MAILTAAGLQKASSAQGASGCIGPSDLESAASGSQGSAAAYDALGVYFATHNQVACATSTFAHALRLDPASWETHYDLGLALFHSGHVQDAVLQFQQALEIRPGNGEVLLALGSAYDGLHDPENAIRQYQLVLKTSPQSVTALLALGKALLAEGRYTTAITWLKNANDEQAQLLLADAYDKNNEPVEAKQTLQAIIDRDPSQLQAHIQLGEVLQRQGDNGSAAQQFMEAMRLDPANEYASVSYLNSEVILQQFVTARPVASQLLLKKPNDFSVVYVNGLIERNLGEDTAAEMHLREAVKLDPDSYEAQYSLGFVLEKLGEPAQAVEHLQAAVRLKPHATEARFQLGRVLRSLGKREEAQAQFAILQQEKQDEAQRAQAADLAKSGGQAFQAGDVPKAIDLYREAIKADPDNSFYYYSLALALDRKGDVQAEQAALQDSVKHNARFAAAHNQLGYLEMQSGNLAAAEAQFKTSVVIDSQFAEAENNLGVLYGKLGRQAEARQMFTRATEDNPRYTQAYVNLALVLASASNFTEARAALETALKLSPLDPLALKVQKLVEQRLKQPASL